MLDVAHLVHVAVSDAIDGNTSLAALSRKFVIKMGAIFKHSPKVFAVYSAICDERGDDAMKIPSVVSVRWESFLRSVDAIVKTWQQIRAFLEQQDDFPRAGEKMKDLIQIFNSADPSKLFAYLLYLQERLKTIMEIQKMLEISRPMIHKMNRIILVQLEAETNKYWHPDEEGSCRAVFQSLSSARHQQVKGIMEKFSAKLR